MFPQSYPNKFPLKKRDQFISDCIVLSDDIVLFIYIHIDRCGYLVAPKLNK